jgi:diketogulonate reductase-like aldo/keto reductase
MESQLESPSYSRKCLRGSFLEYKNFGRSNVKVSAIGMGTFFDAKGITESFIFGHHRNEKEKAEALKKGIELGINFIDTAEIYRTEKYIGEVIKAFEREDLFIATKVYLWHLKYEQVLKAAQRSLSRLQTSYIDLYQIHMPNFLVPIKETISAMERLVSEGKIRYVGVSNFSLAQVKEAESAFSKYELVSVQNKYNLADRGLEVDLLPYCIENNIVIIPYFPLGHGKLTRPSQRQKEALDLISQKYGGKTPAQIALNWFISKSRIVFPIPRASKPKRILENVGATGWAMDKDDIAILEKAFK